MGWSRSQSQNLQHDINNMTMKASVSPSPPNSWHQFLQSPAISYPASNSIGSSSRRSCSEFYWHPKLLKRWQQAVSAADIEVVTAPDECRVHHDDGDVGCGRKEAVIGSLSINYASYILMATFLAEELRHQLSLLASVRFTVSHNHLDRCSSTDVIREDEGNNYGDIHRGLRKVGIAIPEGPFLPLYILAVHSLNVAVGENWLGLVGDDDDNHSDNDANNNEAKTWRGCQGVVIIPMETDEAPERLKHMLADSQPDLILVAPGNDWERMNAAAQSINTTTTDTLASSSCPSTQSCTRLVDFVQLMEDAWSSLCMHVEQNHMEDASLILEQLWPPDIRNGTLDSLRYSHSIHGCFDVARLVALGVVQLSSSSSSLQNYAPRQLISHIVYTSGTTGKPKGCVSSLASLQNYIRAKNLAHSIDSRSRVLLASAVTFDPCFSDVLAVCVGNATLCIVTREQLYSRDEIEDEDANSDHCCRSDQHGSYRGLTQLMRQLEISHVLCTPTLWATVEGTPPNNVPSLQVVALGGEPIPKTMIKKWARRRKAQDGKWERAYPRLCSTYGVTEACVYQTFGEVFSDDSWKSDVPFCPNAGGSTEVPKMSPGQSVGLPLFGTSIHICYPRPEVECVEQFINSPVLRHVEPDASSSEPVIGEVVLSGSQVDLKSSYLNLDVTSRVFIQWRDVRSNFGNDSYFYRTGDLGYIDRVSGNLHILGRIHGDNMVKINGVRVELSEVEHAVIDEELDGNEEGRLVVDCIAALIVCSSMSSDNDEHEQKQLVAYCLLSASSLSQLGTSTEHLKSGVVVPPGPLMSVLRARCNRQVRKGCTPSFFVLIDRIPLSPTGKRCRLSLPNLANCSTMTASMNGKGSISLWDNGVAGSIVADVICECLNLQPCQWPLVTLGKSMLCTLLCAFLSFLTNIYVFL
jgi:acyl-CoA synthetase (AMP-forming)/AMP-acid ligase II